MAEYLLQTSPTDAELFEQVWEVNEDGSARKFGLTGDQTWRARQLDTCFPGSTFHKVKLAPGQYYPRMTRPHSTRPGKSPGCNPDASAEARNARVMSAGNLHAMIECLQHICQVIHPYSDNLKAYGHETRNLLILACTEAEAQWKNIMKENGEADPRDTNHYVKLVSVMRLAEYNVALTWYPWLGDPIAPFRGWNPDAPTQSLQWYAAYNNTKHDRETCFHEATLRNGILALTGCFVMLCAQYGWDFARRDKEGERAFFRLVQAPEWPAEEIYIPGPLQPVHYFLHRA